MNRLKHLILPISATIITIIGSGLSATKAKELLTFNLFSQDKLLHFTCYFVLTILWSYGLYKIKITGSVQKSLWITISVGLLMEVCQYLFFEGRQFEFLDIIANISGSLIGALVFIKIIK